MSNSDTSLLHEMQLINLSVWKDERGFFLESYNQKTFKDLYKITDSFVQDNHSRSQENVLRGLHYQLEHTQGKLVRVLNGEIFDVAVDLRQSSPTFGRAVGIYMEASQHQVLWIPPGFAHGFLVLSKEADFLYKTTDFYHAPSERCLLWNDPALKIDWPIQARPLVSEKDSKGKLFKDLEYFS